MIRRAVLLSLATTLALTAGASGSKTGAKTPDVTRLFKKAVAAVRAEPDFMRAKVLEADGTPAGKKAVKTARKIVRWRFVFANTTPGSDFASATLTYRHGDFGHLVGHPEPFLEDRVIQSAPSMTLKGAIDRLRRAGYHRGFTAVTLRSPLGPKSVPPLYIFAMDSGYIAVNTKNGKVRPIT